MDRIKESDRSWQNGMAKSITFIVTKDCQLACKYCYLVVKNTKERMTWEVAKEAIDYILDREEDFREESVIWDFIGGEPFLEIELIDKICDYLKTEMYRRGHHWFDSYRFSFSTNGINYHTEKVQQFIEKNRSHLSIGITIDGTKRKHDLNRIWKPAVGHASQRDDQQLTQRLEALPTTEQQSQRLEALPTTAVGDLRTGLAIANQQLYRLDHAPICRVCDAYHCRRCVWMNDRLTGDVNTVRRQPSGAQRLATAATANG